MLYIYGFLQVEDQNGHCPRLLLHFTETNDKEHYCFDMVICQPLPLNTGAPGRMADNILGISGGVYPYQTKSF